MKKIISSHNAKITRPKPEDPPCNCRVKEDCPLDGKCRMTNVVYQATVTTEETPPKKETYIGLSSTQFKFRYSNHESTFENQSGRSKTTLSHHIWTLKDKDIEYDLRWKILGRAAPFNPISGVCELCTLEKYFILTQPLQASLNKREEMFNFCYHKKPLLLDKT